MLFAMRSLPAGGAGRVLSCFRNSSLDQLSMDVQQPQDAAFADVSTFYRPAGLCFENRE